jgi:hypothetical protein
MMPKRKGPPAPPQAVYNAGKRKERCSKAIKLVKSLIGDSLYDDIDRPCDPNLKLALEYLEQHRKNLEMV